MAKPPAGSSLLFSALADSGRIKERKNGSYRMVLKGVDEIDWFTDRPYRSEGLWKPQKLIRQWDSFFETSDPNAQASIEVGEERELITFEMFKPKYNSKNQRLSFKLDAEIINDRENDIITDLKGKKLDKVSLFIDDATTGEDSTFLEKWLASPWDFRGTEVYKLNARDAFLPKANLSGSELIRADFRGANLTGANLTEAKLNSAHLESAILTDANLTGANLTDASLISTNLTGADLNGASLEGAFLWRTDLTKAKLIKTDLTDATWRETTCPDGTKNSGFLPCTTEQLNLA